MATEYGLLATRLSTFGLGVIKSEEVLTEVTRIKEI